MEMRAGTFVIGTEFWGRELNLFLVRGEHSLLIDTGLAGMLHDLIFPYMDQHGLSRQSLKLAANTHAHADHMGGNGEIKAQCPWVQIGAHELDRPWIENHDRLCCEFYEREPYGELFGEGDRERVLTACGEDSPVDVVWRGGEIIDLGGRRLEVVHAGGHSPGNLVFLDREQGILFEGETILGGASGEPGELKVPYYHDVAVQRATLRYLLELPWDLLLSSHAAPRGRADGLRAIGESLDFIEQFAEQARGVLCGLRRPASFQALRHAMSQQHGYADELGLALLLDTHLEHERRAGRAVQLEDGDWLAR